MIQLPSLSVVLSLLKDLTLATSIPDGILLRPDIPQLCRTFRRFVLRVCRCVVSLDRLQHCHWHERCRFPRVQPADSLRPARVPVFRKFRGLDSRPWLAHLIESLNASNSLCLYWLLRESIRIAQLILKSPHGIELGWAFSSSKRRVLAIGDVIIGP